MCMGFNANRKQGWIQSYNLAGFQNEALQRRVGRGSFFNNIHLK